MRKLLLLFLLVTANVVCYSANQCRPIIEPDMGRAPLLHAIAKARHSLILVIYELTDPTFLHALLNAQRRGVKVKVLIEAKPYKAGNVNRYAINKLRHAHIFVAHTNPAYLLTHQKALIIDHHQAIIMTMNFLPRSFKATRNLAIIINNERDIAQMRYVFFADLARRPVVLYPSDLVWSPNNTRSRLSRLLFQAKKTINIYAMELADYRFVGELAKRARQGIKVEILMPKKMINKQKKAIAYLQRAGAHVHFSTRYFIHAKMILIDSNLPSMRAYVGSANISSASFDKNRELGMILNHNHCSQVFAKLFQQDWKNSQRA